jgi:CrcB protein
VGRVSVAVPVLVGAGGVCGAVARHLLGERVDARAGDTLAVNLLGSFLLGAVLAAEPGPALVHFFGTGFCGALTTFSSFAVDTVRLAEDGEPGLAAGNAAINLVGALLAVAAGGLAAGLL